VAGAFDHQSGERVSKVINQNVVRFAAALAVHVTLAELAGDVTLASPCGLSRGRSQQEIDRRSTNSVDAFSGDLIDDPRIGPADGHWRARAAPCCVFMRATALISPRMPNVQVAPNGEVEKSRVMNTP
jgi:hypothetical protein